MTRLRPLLAALLLCATAVPSLAQDPAAPATQPALEAAPAEGTVGAQSEPAPEGSDASAAMLEALSPLIADVQIVGPWTDGERNGIWRTITLQPEGDGSGNRFFVQQIERVGETPAVSSSTEIIEVGELAGALISYRADGPSETQPDLLTLFMEIVPLDGEIAETYELFFTVGEPYTFGPASN